MTVQSYSFQLKPRFALIISAALSELMKLFRYMRPTARWTRAQQERATARNDIHFDVVEGVEGRTFDTLLKLLKPGNGVIVESLQVFARRRDVICNRLRAIFAKGCVVIDANGTEYRPEHEAVVCAGVMTGGYVIKEPQPRVAHNKIDDETLDRARELWTDEAFARMTNLEISKAVGVSTVTLNRAFGPRGRKPGRPKKPTN